MEAGLCEHLCSAARRILCGTQAAHAQWAAYPDGTYPNSPYTNGASAYPNGAGSYPNASPQPYGAYPQGYPQANYGYGRGYQYYPAYQHAGTSGAGYYQQPRYYPVHHGHGGGHYLPPAAPYAGGGPAPLLPRLPGAGGKRCLRRLRRLLRRLRPCCEQKPCLPLHKVAKEKCWVAADYLGAIFREARTTTPLVTTGSLNDARPAALGSPGTQILFGDRYNYELSSGVRLEAGFFLNPENTLSLEAGGFYFYPTKTNFTVSSDPGGNPLIARPFFDLNRVNERGFRTSSPGLFSGTVSVDAEAELAGIEFNGRCHHCCGPHFRVDGLLGFRFLRLAESLTIRDRLRPIQDNQLTFLGAPVNAPNQLADEDVFSTTNRFYGMQIGGRVRWEHDWFFADSFLKVALGATEQR